MNFPSLQEIWDTFIRYLYSDTELVIWIGLAITAVITVALLIYSTTFRQIFGIMVVLGALIIWLIQTYGWPF